MFIQSKFILNKTKLIYSSAKGSDVKPKLKMKKIMIVLITAMAMVTVFVNCKKEKETGEGFVIEATNVLNNGNDVAKVAAVSIDLKNEEEAIIASCKFENNGFKLTLPKTLASKYLASWDYEGIDWVILSDKKAKVGSIDLWALNGANEPSGGFYLEKSGSNEYQDGEATYIYADRDFTMKGKIEGVEEDDEFTYSWSQEFDCSFQKGWNIIYVTYNMDINTQDVTVFATTQKPSGTNWIWKLYSWEYLEKNQTHAIKNIKNLKKNFLHK